MDSRDVPQEDGSVLSEAASALVDPFDPDAKELAVLVLKDCASLNPEAVAWCVGKTRASAVRILWGILKAEFFLEKYPEFRRPRVLVGLGDPVNIGLDETTGDVPVAVTSSSNEPDDNDFVMFGEDVEDGD